MKTINSSHSLGNTRFQGIRALWTLAMILWISVAANPSFGQFLTEKPHTISYQGTLMKSGAPVTSGAYKITVTLYSDEAGSQSVWSDEYNTEVKDGLFNILLGSAKTLPSGIDLDQLYLGVKINGTSELRPLTQIASASTSITVADNSITKDKLATDYVAGISINGKKVTGKGSTLNIKDGSGIGLQYDEKTHSLSVNSTAGLGNTNPQIHNGGIAVDYWGEAGNTQPGGTEFFGSTDNTTVTQKCFGIVALRLQPPTGLGTVPNIVGGDIANTITGTQGSTIAGGGGFLANTIASDFCFIGSGLLNTIDPSCDFSTIGCGDQNHIWENCDHATIAGGGWSNEIGSSALDPANQAYIGGGFYNHIFAPVGVINGGWNNQIIRNTSMINNGELATIGGGSSNHAEGFAATIAGGGSNHADNNFASVGGGDDNVVSNEYATIAGGKSNTVTGDKSTIGGGVDNDIQDGNEGCTIAGGETNMIQATTGVTMAGASIGGGVHNKIFPGCSQSTIAGGNSNQIERGADVGNPAVFFKVSAGTIGGGISNVIEKGGDHDFIGGGEENRILAGVSGGFTSPTQNATIGGGGGQVIGGRPGNQVTSSWGSVLGGAGNVAGSGGNPSKMFQSVGGGRGNVASGDRATISGGELNTASGDQSSILAGFTNATNLAGQVAGGYLNATRGTFPSTMTQAMNATNPIANPVPAQKIADAYNTPLFMLGNGGSALFATHNAFEVSYNGHSTVFDKNGTGAVRAAIEGSTYTDNVCYAWAYVTPFQVGAPPPIPPARVATVNKDFGVASVIETAPGVFTVTLNTNTPAGVPLNLTGSSIMVTFVSSPCNRFASVTPIAGNIFTITITKMVFGVAAPPFYVCDPWDEEFMFQVFGRP